MISVIVPVYNVGEKLECCMDSLLAQTYTDYEIILVDDGSRPKDALLCDRQAARSPKARVIHKPNGGVASARNCGIDQARGEYIAFLDPDDWVEPDYLKMLLKMHEQSGAAISVCGCYIHEHDYDRQTIPIGKATVYSREEALKLLLNTRYSLLTAVWNKLFSKKLIDAHHLRFDEELLSVEDLHFTFRSFMCCESVAYDPKPLYHYRLNGGSVSLISSALTRRKMSGLMAFEKTAALARESDYPFLERDIYREQFNYCLGFLYAYYYNKSNAPDMLAELRSVLKTHRNDFFPNDCYSRLHNALARIALVSPRTYYRLLQLKRRLVGQE